MKSAVSRRFGESIPTTSLSPSDENSSSVGLNLFMYWITFGSVVVIFFDGVICFYVCCWGIVGIFLFWGNNTNLTHSLLYSTPHHILKYTITATPTALNVNIKVGVGEGEPIESALRRFKREVNKSGHLQDLRAKRYFENSQDKKKRKIVQARFRVRMERMKDRKSVV